MTKLTRGAGKPKSGFKPKGSGVNGPETLLGLTKEELNFTQLSTSGLEVSGKRSTIEEEFLTTLRGERGRKIYREMRDNDPVVGALLYAVEMLTRNVTWRVQPEGQNIERAEFVESCMNDMSFSWEDTITETLSMLTYGFAFHETVYKRRLGDSPDPSKNSRYNDGAIGWRKLPLVGQNTIDEWLFDEDGGIMGAIQQDYYGGYGEVELPIEQALLFRTTTHKNNPIGRSILRNAYRPWYLKRRIEEFEAIGIERDLAGMPVIYRTAEMGRVHDVTLQKILRNVRKDEQMGLLLPLAYDDKGNKLLTFELLASPGSRQIDTTKPLARYDHAIATVVLADFILLGQQQVGSFALSSSKTKLFATALGAFLGSIAAVYNRFAIPRLFRLNGWPVEEMPKLVPGDIESPDLEELGQWLKSLTDSGAMLFPDDDLENHLRGLSNLPQKAEEEEE